MPIVRIILFSVAALVLTVWAYGITTANKPLLYLGGVPMIHSPRL
jgi:hypothetical protein